MDAGIEAAASGQQETVEQLEAALHELRHRLRNAYAVSSAITLASARETPDHRDFAAALAQRFAALSLVQTRQLDRPGGETLDGLAGKVVAAFAAPGAVSIGALPDVALDEQQARLVALLLCDLCAGSVGRGALAEGRRAIEVDGRCDGGRLTLEWREAGAGEDAGDDPGHRLMARLARAHGAGLVRERSGDLAIVRLDLPLAVSPSDSPDG